MSILASRIGMRVAMAFAVLTLAACEEPALPPPNPAVVALQRNCEAGDTNACGLILQAEQADYQQRLALASALRQGMQASTFTPAAPALVYQAPIVQAPAPAVVPLPPSVMPGTRMMNCTPTIGGGMSCSTP